MNEVEGEDWTVNADSTINRAHQHAAGARRAPAADDPTGAASNDKKAWREALGKSRGGWPTKIHLVADRRCRPYSPVTTL